VPERLSELQRQRALVQAHLAWLDGEIAAASGRALPPGSGSRADAALPTAAPGPAPAPASPLPGADATADAEALLRQYGSDPASATAEVRRGCWVAFAGAFLALGLFVLLWYLLRRGP